jgi:hypothetical protein
MIFRLALRSLLTHPVRSLVLACGFGLGVGVMATLLGVGEVILDQARSPAVSGGGDVVIASSTGELPSARWILSSGLPAGVITLRRAQGAPSLSRGAGRVSAASPSRRATLYLVKNSGVVPIRVQGGIPSLERAIGDPETSSITSWTDADSDAAWSSPDPGDALAALDRFHPIPDVPLRADSWAEWLYFNGRAGDNRFYLTFLVGPALSAVEGPKRDPRRAGLALPPSRKASTDHRSLGGGGETRRAAGVRLQLDRAGKRSSYSQTQDVNEADVLRTAPNLTIGSSRVRLDGLRYHITLDLPSDADRQTGTSRVTGDIFIEASPGRALPPLTIRGAGGWVSGYVVPVMSGRLTGTLTVDGTTVDLNDGTGYHDHNWGFWKDVSWQWGQVQHGDLSLVYGRIRPPADAADPDRIPGFLAAIGPDGPEGYATNVSIAETKDRASGHPRRIVVTGRSSSLDLAMDLTVESTTITKTGVGLFGGGMDFLQLRTRYRVRGRAGDRSIDFTAPGTAETFSPRVVPQNDDGSRLP